jgi:hypothetical protein
VAATGSFEDLEGVVAFCHDFANAVAATVGTGGAEHDLALEEHCPCLRSFRVGLQKMGQLQSSVFCIENTCFHHWKVNLCLMFCV